MTCTEKKVASVIMDLRVETTISILLHWYKSLLYSEYLFLYTKKCVALTPQQNTFCFVAVSPTRNHNRSK